MDLEQRIENLERQNRRLKLGGLASLVLLSLVFLLGQAGGVSEEIAAKKFLLMDDAGNYRGVLNVAQGVPTLALLDSSGIYRVSVAASDDGPSIALYDQAMNPRLLLSEKLELRNTKGKVVWKAP
jgi:hypothetical protein